MLQFDTLIVPSDTLTIRSVEECAWEVAGYIADLSNWPKQIVDKTGSCDDFIFEYAEFERQGARWSCE